MSAISNYAAALFLKEDFTSCVKACEDILSILSKSQSRKISPKNQVEFGGIPPQGSKQRQKLVITRLSRKGAACTKLGDYKDALIDLTKAQGIFKNDNSNPASTLDADIKDLHQKIKLRTGTLNNEGKQ